MKIDIKLLNNTLVAEEVQAEQANKIIDGFFGILNNRSDTHPKEITTVVTTVNNGNTTAVAEKVTEIMKKEQPRQTLTKTLPKIDDERRMNVSIGEIIGKENFSNVRESEDGQKLYQTGYWCNCGHEGKRYIPETNDYTKCHQCGEKLLVEPATLDDDEYGIPVADKDGNFFIAREKYETEDIND